MYFRKESSLHRVIQSTRAVPHQSWCTDSWSGYPKFGCRNVPRDIAWNSVCSPI